MRFYIIIRMLLEINGFGAIHLIQFHPLITVITVEPDDSSNNISFHNLSFTCSYDLSSDGRLVPIRIKD